MLDDSEVVVVVDPGLPLAESFVFVVFFDASMVGSVCWKMSLNLWIMVLVQFCEVRILIDRAQPQHFAKSTHILS